MIYQLSGAAVLEPGVIAVLVTMCYLLKSKLFMSTGRLCPVCFTEQGVDFDLCIVAVNGCLAEMSGLVTEVICRRHGRASAASGQTLSASECGPPVPVGGDSAKMREVRAYKEETRGVMMRFDAAP